MLVEGLHALEALAADLLISDQKIAHALGPVLVKGGQAVARSMRTHIPDPVYDVRGFQVRPHVTSDRAAHTGDDGSRYVEAGPTHFVARFLENGTARMAPRPFVDVSIEENLDALVIDITAVTGNL